METPATGAASTGILIGVKGESDIGNNALLTVQGQLKEDTGIFMGAVSERQMPILISVSNNHASSQGVSHSPGTTGNEASVPLLSPTALCFLTAVL